MRKTQTVHTCDRCGKQVIGAQGVRKSPDGWLPVQVPVSPPDGPILVVDADLCEECARNLALWMAPREV